MNTDQFMPPMAALPAIPASVPRAQAKIALFRAGKLDAVKAAVAAAGGEVEIWFEDALTWDLQN